MQTSTVFMEMKCIEAGAMEVPSHRSIIERKEWIVGQGQEHQTGNREVIQDLAITLFHLTT